MDKMYYKEYYFLERNHWYFKARNGIIMNFISKMYNTGDKSLRILNVGAGTGFTSQLLEEFGRVKSIEYDQDCFEFVVSNINIDMEQGSITNLPFEEASFDLVCAFDVIEHVEEDKIAVSELKRVCKVGGDVVVTVPAFMMLWSSHDIVNHHYRRYTIQKLKALFDFEIKFTSYYNFFLFPPILLFRMLNKTLGFTRRNSKNSGSDFAVVRKTGLVSRILYQVFYFESKLLNWGMRLPFGVSILLSARKN